MNKILVITLQIGSTEYGDPVYEQIPGKLISQVYCINKDVLPV